MAEHQKSYDCQVCPAYCCCLPEIAVTPSDLSRLAQHFGVDENTAKGQYTEINANNSDEMILHQQPDGVYGTACGFLDLDTRQCTVYEARPAVCHAVPGGSHCGYYDFLMAERATQQDPDHVALVEPLLETALSKHQAGQLDEALQIYGRVIAAAPNHPDAHHLRGLCHLMRGEGEVEVEVEVEVVLSCLSRAVELAPHQAAFQVSLGNAYQKFGRLDESIATYRAALEVDPANLGAHINQGYALYDLGRFDEAAACLRQALEQAPDSLEALNGLGITCIALKNLDEAEQYLGQAIAIDDSHLELHNNLGTVLRQQGRLGEALSRYQKVLEIDPNNAGVHGNIGLTLMEQGALDDARLCYEQAATLGIDDAETWLSYHALLYRDGDLDPAAEIIKQALVCDPEHEASHFHLGVIRDIEGNEEEADRHFAALRYDDEGYNPLLDSWDYAKRHQSETTRYFKTVRETLDFCVDQANESGLVLEFGVRFGTTVRMIAERSKQDVHGFDSFEGLPEAWYGLEGQYSTHGVLPNVPDTVTLHKGWFQDSLPGFLAAHDGPVRFAHIDCDLYSSTASIFAELGSRIVSGSVIVFDEYLINAAWREDEFKAFQEAVEQYGWEYDYLAFGLLTKQAGVVITAVS
jgi:tetratricopeptide (TPR) repeat protein